VSATWRIRLSRALPFIAFFVIALWITLPAGLTTPIGPYHLGLFDSSLRVRQILGGSDGGSLLTAAENLKANGRITPEFAWVYSYWPPGMVVIDRIFLQGEKWFGLPIVLMMVILNSALWALLLGAWFTLVRTISSLGPAVVFGAGALLYSGISGWGMGSGIFYSDSFGVIGLGFALLFLVMAARADSARRRWRWAALAGAGLAFAAHFRASFELVADATLLLSGIVIVVALVARWRGGLPRFTSWATVSVLPLVIVGVVAQVLMLPWRIFAGLSIHPGDFRWSAVSDLASSARWLPESVMRERNNLFGLTGHSNWACLSDPEQCQTIFDLEQTADVPYGGANGGYFTGAQFDQMTLHSVLTHPLNYLLERIDALGLGFASDTGGAIHSFAMAESIAIAALFVAIVVIFIRTRAFANPAYLFFFASVATQAATLLLLHMEPRYFLGIELSIVLMGGYALATVYRNRVARSAETAAQR